MQTINRNAAIVKEAHDPGDPLITSHCPFCGSGQVIGRSDGTIACDLGFCGQNYIVRVQPAFPGAPQMPNPEGGAPSDIGPDGGVVGPDAIGPDGMPMDGGMPGDDDGAPFGDDEEDQGTPPFGAPGGGDSDQPPPGSGSPAGDSKKEDKGSGGTPKGKGKKKASRVASADAMDWGPARYVAPPRSREELWDHIRQHHGITSKAGSDPDRTPGQSFLIGLHDRFHAGELPDRSRESHQHEIPAGSHDPVFGKRYRGFDGQALTEDQYIRHLAVTMSGGHPAVLAALRAEAAGRRTAVRRVTAHDGPHMPVDTPDQLRRHLSDVHGIGPAAGLMRPEVAAHVHELDHRHMADTGRIGDWEHSPDAARSPQFIARRRRPFARSAADEPRGPHRILPGDIMSQYAQVGRLRNMRDRMKAEGFPVRETWGPEGGRQYEQVAPLFTLDTGHSVSVGLSRANDHWVMNVHHPDDNRIGRTMIHSDLGVREADVPRLVRRELGHRDVIPHMVEQMRGTASPGPRGGFTMIRRTAPGATLPESGDDYAEPGEEAL